MSSEIVKEVLRKYPQASSYSLARMLKRDYPEIFSTEEHARMKIRYYRGAMGVFNRERISEESYIPKLTIPRSEAPEYLPFRLEGDVYPIIVAGDAHVPYHDPDAIEIMLERAIDIQAKSIILLGDWLDCYQISSFDRDPRNMPFSAEIKVLRGILKTIRLSMPGVRIIYKIGNHEERMGRYINAHAPALVGLDSTTIEEQIDPGNRMGIEFVNDRRVISLEHLHLIHGHEYEFAISNPVSPARGLYLRAKKNAICAHFHQTSEHSESAIDGKVTKTWSIGGMCDMHPKYRPLNKWNLGFAEISKDDDSFMVRNRSIINYKLV